MSAAYDSETTLPAFSENHSEKGTRPSEPQQLSASLAAESHQPENKSPALDIDSPIDFNASAHAAPPQSSAAAFFRPLLSAAVQYGCGWCQSNSTYTGPKEGLSVEP